MKALVLVDIQRDFLPGGALAAPEGDRILPHVEALIDQFDLVVATQDWHPPGHCSFAEFGEHCLQNSKGAELIFPTAKVFQKGTKIDRDAFSGFDGTDLADYLRSHDVDEIWIAGLVTDYCVKATALDGLKEGFKVTVVQRACAPLHEDEEALKEIQQAGGTIE